MFNNYVSESCSFLYLRLQKQKQRAVTSADSFH